jgi:hypothetical protein
MSHMFNNMRVEDNQIIIDLPLISSILDYSISISLEYNKNISFHLQISDLINDWVTNKEYSRIGAIITRIYELHLSN